MPANSSLRKRQVNHRRTSAVGQNVLCTELRYIVEVKFLGECFRQLALQEAIR